MAESEKKKKKKKKPQLEAAGKKTRQQQQQVVVAAAAKKKKKKARPALIFSASEVQGLFSTETREDDHRERYIYIIFSSRKMMGENFWNLCASRVTNSDTIHVAILFDDGHQCSINTITDAVTMTRVERLDPGQGVREAERRKAIYQFSVSERTYASIQERIRSHIRNQTSYDILSWYAVGIFGTCFNPSSVGSHMASHNTVTCSRLFYDILRDPEVAIIDAEAANDGILPHQLKQLVEESTMGVEPVSIVAVNRRLGQVGAVGGIIIAAQS